MESSWSSFGIRKVTFLRLFLGAVFIYASLSKIRFPLDFLKVVYNYRLFPDTLSNLIAIVLPWLELFLGICLISGFMLEGAILLVNILLISFFLAILLNTIRGMNVECGCFDLKENPSARISMIWYLIRDGILVITGLYLFKEVKR